MTTVHKCDVLRTAKDNVLAKQLKNTLYKPTHKYKLIESFHIKEKNN